MRVRILVAVLVFGQLAGPALADLADDPMPPEVWEARPVDCFIVDVTVERTPVAESASYPPACVSSRSARLQWTSDPGGAVRGSLWVGASVPTVCYTASPLPKQGEGIHGGCVAPPHDLRPDTLLDFALKVAADVLPPFIAVTNARAAGDLAEADVERAPVGVAVPASVSIEIRFEAEWQAACSQARGVAAAILDPARGQVALHVPFDEVCGLAPGATATFAWGSSLAGILLRAAAPDLPGVELGPVLAGIEALAPRPTLPPAPEAGDGRGATLPWATPTLPEADARAGTSGGPPDPAPLFAVSGVTDASAGPGGVESHAQASGETLLVEARVGVAADPSVPDEILRGEVGRTAGAVEGATAGDAVPRILPRPPADHRPGPGGDGSEERRPGAVIVSAAQRLAPAPVAPSADRAAVALAGAALSAVLLGIAAVALYQRVQGPRAADHPARAALEDALARADAPRSSAHLARETGLGRKTAEYHLLYLARLGLVRMDETETGARLFARFTTPRAPSLADALVALARERPGVSVGEAATALGVSRPKLDRRAKDLVLQGRLASRVEADVRRLFAE